MNEKKSGSLDHIKPSEVDYDLRHIRDDEMMAPIEETYYERDYVTDVLRTEKRPDIGVMMRASTPSVYGLLTVMYEDITANQMKLADDLKRTIFYGSQMVTSDSVRCVPNHPLLGDKLRYLHVALGVLTEAHELFASVMAHLETNMPFDTVNFREELGDMLWYIAIGAHATGDTDLSRLMQGNIRKLKARYPEKFTDAEALTRDLESERKVLEAHTPKYYDCFWMDHESQISYMVRFREYGLSGIEVVSVKSDMDHGGNEVDLSAKWYKCHAASIIQACIEALPNAKQQEAEKDADA